MASGSRPTHRDIARKAGVSNGTVSLALRDDPRISEETRERIKRIAMEMGYKPNPSVSMLMSHIRSRKSAEFSASIAYLSTLPLDAELRRSEKFTQHYDGARSRAEEMGFSMELFEWHEEGMTARRLESILLNRGIRGIVMEYHPVPEIGQDRITLDWSKFATVTVGAYHHEPVFDHATSDYFGAAAMAYKEVRNLGYRRIGMAMSYYSDSVVHFGMTGGFHSQRQFFRDENDIPVMLVKNPDHSDYIEWFETYQPEVIIGQDWRTHHYIRESGRRIPADVGWVYVGWYHLWPNLTGMDLNENLVGEAGVDLLSSLLHRNFFGPPKRPRTITVESDWHRGKTTWDSVNGQNEGIIADQPFV